MDDVLCISINVSSIIIILLDLFCGCDQLANVDGSRMSEIFQVIGQVLELVS
jgi:hypothetical protein